MRKTSLYIDDGIDEALTRRAESEGVSKAEVIRRALADAAEAAPPPRFKAIGIFTGGPTDLAANDEKYLAESGFGEA